VAHNKVATQHQLVRTITAKCPTREFRLGKNPYLQLWPSQLQKKTCLLGPPPQAASMAEQSWSNFQFIASHGVKLMLQLGWTAIPKDKEPGFNVVHLDELNGIHAELLNGHACGEVAPYNLSMPQLHFLFASCCVASGFTSK